MESDENDWAIDKANEYEEEGNDKEHGKDSNL